jgi:hypothetical protein
MGWLPQFLRHYRLAGVDDFIITLHVDLKLPAIKKVRSFRRFQRILNSHKINRGWLLDCLYDSEAVRKHHDRLQLRICQPKDWIVWADIDEFHEYPRSLTNLVSLCKRNRNNVIGGVFVDRVTESGEMTQFDPRRSIWQQYPLDCHLTRDVLGAWTTKVVCSRADVLITHGNHLVRRNQSASWFGARINIHHFKWDSSVRTRLQARLRDDWKARCPWWNETERFFHFIKATGRLNLREVNCARSRYGY